MKKTEKHALTVRIALLVMLDILFMQVASFASLWIRHEFDFQAVEETFIHTVWRYMPLNILVTLAVFSMFHLYTSFGNMRASRNYPVSLLLWQFPVCYTFWEWQ